MAQRVVAYLIVERLKAWGVDRVFDYSGDGINGFMGALRRARADIGFVQARHEETAAFKWRWATPSTPAGWAW